MGVDMATLADRMAITDLIYRYCRSMDRMDHELGYTLWHNDAEVDYGPLFHGGGREFIDWVCEMHRPMIAQSHQITNIIIELHGDRAATESYVTAALRYRQNERLMEATVRGRYLDRWSRRAGRWGMDKRVYVQDFDDAREILASNAEGWGRRDRDDPSYRVLSLEP